MLNIYATESWPRPLHQELGQLRSDAAQTFTNMEHQAQGEGQQLAMEYQRLVDELIRKRM